MKGRDADQGGVAELRRFLAEGLRAQYLVDAPIGAGGMAVVFAGRDVDRKRPVAIKVLNPEIASAVAVARFIREIEWSSSLQHPHIVPVLSSGDVNGVPYLVMPLIEGETLGTRLERSPPLDTETGLAYARDIAAALDYAHRKGIVHRDIMPDNILLSDGFALVADFGVARALGLASGNTLTGSGAPIGTLAYMSPEQATGSSPVDGRSDIYSLGCVAYEMLTGRRAFDGATMGRIIEQKLDGTGVSTASFPEEVPPAAAEAIVRAMQLAPEARFASAREFADALGGVRAPRVTRELEAAPRPVAARRTGLWLVIAAAVALAALLVIMSRLD